MLTTRAARHRPRFRRGGRPARRGIAGTALQSRTAFDDAREHLPGHQRGRRRHAHGVVEPSLSGDVRLPERPRLRRSPDRRPDPLQRRARRVRPGRSRGTRLQAPASHARRHGACLPARTSRRQRSRNARAAIAGRRLRHDLHRRHRLQEGRARPARSQRNPRTARRPAHRRSCPPRSKRRSSRATRRKRPTSPSRASSPRPATTCCSRSMPPACSPRRCATSPRSMPNPRSWPNASTPHSASPKTCSNRCSRLRDSMPASTGPKSTDVALADLIEPLVQQFSLLAQRRGLEFRVIPSRAVDPQRSAPAAPHPAELLHQRAALYAQGPRRPRCAPRRRRCAHRALGYRARNRRRTTAADLRRVPSRRRRIALGRAGARAGTVDLRAHCAHPRSSVARALLARTWQLLCDPGAARTHACARRSHRAAPIDRWSAICVRCMCSAWTTSRAILDGMAALLTRWGMSCDLAANRTEAPAALLRRRPDLILVDFHLGTGPDGIEVLGELLASLQSAAAGCADHGRCQPGTQAACQGARPAGAAQAGATGGAARAAFGVCAPLRQRPAADDRRRTTIGGADRRRTRPARQDTITARSAASHTGCACQ